jgi:hypothetical protein
MKLLSLGRSYLKNHNLISLILVFILGGLIIGITVFLLVGKSNNSQNSAAHVTTAISSNSNLLQSEPTTTPSASAESKNATVPTKPSPSSSAQQTPNTVSSQSNSPLAPTPLATLPNCTYGTGPHTGDHCPASPPPSWSYSVTWTCTNNGIGVPCAAYEDTTLISSYTYNSKDFCQFYYSAGYKVVQVFDYHKYSEIDCSTAIAM